MTEKEKVFFENVVAFPEISNDGLIETKAFLEASRCIVQFVELFGTAFIPVKSDIEGNINKLSALLATDQAKFKYLNAIVEVEKQTLGDSELHVGTDALTWLNRALVYNQTFLTFFINEYRSAATEEEVQLLPDNINQHFSKAYELTLKKYHGWFVQKIFSMCLMAAPSRTKLLNYLGYANFNLSLVQLKEVILETIEKYLNMLKLNTEAVSILLLSFGLQP